MKMYQCALVLLALVSPVVNAEIAVVVNPSVNVGNAVSQDIIQRIFLGKTSRFESGTSSSPINQNDTNPIREEFITKVLGKTQGEYRAYWARLIFTGKGRPPDELDNDAAVKQRVASDPGVVGYINANAVDDSVKVIFTIK